MSKFTLALDPIRSWDVLLSSDNTYRTKVRDERHVVMEGMAADLAATIEYSGSNFGVNGAGLRAGTATVDTYRMTIGGQVVLEITGASVTGAPLSAWVQGDGSAFLPAALAGDDTFLLSNLADRRNGFAGDDILHGFGGNDTLLGGDGNDTLHGNEGNDRLDGENGLDTAVGGRGSDTFYGGAGTDTFVSGMLRKLIRVDVVGSTATLSEPVDRDTVYDVERLAFLDGTLHLDPTGAAGQVWRLYGAALGRPAETTGLSAWVAMLDSGTASLTDTANNFLNSAEFAARYGDLDNPGFVTRLYANVLGRSPDAAGLEGWTSTLAGGASRASVLLGFSESAEYRDLTRFATVNKLWTVDAEAMDVLRCYVTILDRTPDAGGLAFWTSARDNDLTNAEMMDEFIGSAEFQTRFGGLSNEGFVSRLYPIALDRTADAAGQAYWTSALDSGAVQRRDVVQGFAYSDEMTLKLLPLVGDGIAFA